MVTPKDNRGGKREGAGRKPSGKRKRNYYVTDQEHKAIKKFIELIRADLVREGNKMMGEYINQWYVTDEQTGKDHEYKTEQAAKKKYDSISGHARLVRETNVVNQDITILEK